MTSHSRARRTTGAAFFTSAMAGATLLSAGTGVALASGPVAAAGSCDATAIELSVLGQASVAVSRAGSQSAACADQASAVDLGALGIVGARAVDATTTANPGGGASARSTIADLRVGAGGIATSLTGPLLAGPDDIGGELTGALAPLVGPGGVVTQVLAPLQALGLDVVGMDPSALLREAGPGLPAALSAALPDVLSAGLIDARATATCSAGVAGLTGSTTLTGLRVLGTPVDAEDAAGRVISLDTARLGVADLVSVNAVLRSITVRAAPASVLGLLVGPGQQSLYDLLTTPDAGLLAAVNAVLPVGSTLSSVLDSLSSGLAPVIRNLEIPLPAGLLRATVTPHREVRDASGLTEAALTLTVTGLSQPILAGEIARARVGAGSAACGPTPTPTPTPTSTPPVTIQGDPVPGPGGGAKDPVRFPSEFAEDALSCGTQRLRLLEVGRLGNRTAVEGVAERRYVGSRATIFLTEGRKKVGTTIVRADGRFAARVALPPARIRNTSKARYFAIISGDRTRALKLTRRMVITGLTESGGKLTFSGRTTLPRAANQQAVRIQARISCSAYRTVATVKPDAKGRFKATFAAPSGTETGVYRAATKVPTAARSRKLKPTYTLPTLVEPR